MTQRDDRDRTSVATRLEGAHREQVPTRHEPGRTESVPTHREHADAVPTPYLGPLSLPDDLARQFHVVRQSPSVSTEATLFEAVEICTGETRMLKLYHRGVTLRQEALRRVQSVDPAHAVELFDFGRLSDGRWYEVQESISGDNLVEFRRRRTSGFKDAEIVAIVAEISEAIAAFHQAGLAHHDIKPENILMRRESPLDLVLSDFGLAVASDTRTYFLTNHNATPSYQSPETMAEVGGEARDFWALGMTVAMLATGNQPYAGLNPHGIMDQHIRRIPPPIIEEMSDGRIKQLCRGLTRYETRKRWGIDEVRGWVEGENPSVASEGPPAVTVNRAVRFNQKDFGTPRDLASELVMCWDKLTAAIIKEENRRDLFMNEVIWAFGTDEIAELGERWNASPPSDSSADAAIAALVVALDPERPASYRGRPLTRDSIAALGENDRDRRFIHELWNSRILSAWARSPRHRELGAIDQQWRTEMREALETIYRLQEVTRVTDFQLPPQEEWRRLLLAACARPELVRQWRQKAESTAPQGRFAPSWYRVPVSDSPMAALLAAALLAETATSVQRFRRKIAEAEKLRKSLWYRKDFCHYDGAVAAAVFIALVAAPVFQWYTVFLAPDGWQWGDLWSLLGSLLFGGSGPLLMLRIALFCQLCFLGADEPNPWYAVVFGLVAGVSVVDWYAAGFDQQWVMQGMDPSWLTVLSYSLVGALSLGWPVLRLAAYRFDLSASGVRALLKKAKGRLRRAFSSPVSDTGTKSAYRCIRCRTPLFWSDDMFYSGTREIIFNDTLERAPILVELRSASVSYPSGRPPEDRSDLRREDVKRLLRRYFYVGGLFKLRASVKCGTCGTPVGRVVTDGPPPTGLLYTIESDAIFLDANDGPDSPISPENPRNKSAAS